MHVNSRPLVFVACLALLLVLAARFWDHTVDDAFISFRYADNLVSGDGLVFNPGERVEGYTYFLWVLLIAPALALGLDPEIVARVLGLAASIGLLAAVVRHSPARAARFPPRAGALVRSVPRGRRSVRGLALGLLRGSASEHVLRQGRRRDWPARARVALPPRVLRRRRLLAADSDRGIALGARRQESARARRRDRGALLLSGPRGGRFAADVPLRRARVAAVLLVAGHRRHGGGPALREDEGTAPRRDSRRAGADRQRRASRVSWRAGPSGRERPARGGHVEGDRPLLRGQRAARRVDRRTHRRRDSLLLRSRGDRHARSDRPHDRPKHTLDRRPTYVVVGTYGLAREPLPVQQLLRPFYPAEKQLLLSRRFHDEYRAARGKTASGFFAFFVRHDRT